MLVQVQLGLVLLLVTARVMGKRSNRFTHMVFLNLAVGLVALHLLMRPVNLYQTIGAEPSLKDTLSVRLAARKLEKARQVDLVNDVKRTLLNEENRVRYLYHGENSLKHEIRNKSDSAEYVVKSFGPSLVWYVEALLVIIAVSSGKTVDVTSYGLFALACVGAMEFVIKNSDSFLSFGRLLPYDTPYDTMELLRVISGVLFGLLVYMQCMEYEDRLGYAFGTINRIANLNDILLKSD